ncbi:threonine synthase [Flavobacteriaceae bacterium]|jgi:threonine synthase|nr:threonine synthase [Flavobacteriaceae bacterium]MDC0478396.1 threonine synthase [Flavobacteriaceae bacterium]
MNYYSLNKKSSNVTFKEALIKGLAPDKGLYFPEKINKLSESFIANINNYSNEEIAYECIHQFIGSEIPESDLRKIITDVLSFDFPLTKLNDQISFLELFHGPTMAFKDVGARFMARCLAYFLKNQDEKKSVTVLVATSGDTGGAVASGFYKVKGIKVVILYPKGKVSNVQEKQLTTLGENITALEVDGTFDDCQAMVKKAFLDEDLSNNINLTSANSINIARWLPQMFYFFFSYRDFKLSHSDKIAFSVPSGNFGNICAGMMAKEMGLPINKFIASNNINDVVNRYLKTKIYDAKPSIQTISNAMDVGDPSNFVRIINIYKNDFNLIKNNLHTCSFTDDETVEGIKELINKFNYIPDPHGAVGFLGVKDFIESNPNYKCIILETAHPAKFSEVINLYTDNLVVPDQISSVINKKKKSVEIDGFLAFKNFLLDS